MFKISSLQADPWFTGPILAPSGITIPPGHANFEPYVFYTENTGVFNRQWKLSASPMSTSTIFNPILTYGLTTELDVQFTVPYLYNQTRNSRAHRLGDSALSLGYQVLEQRSKWQPNLRIAVQEVIPTGRFDNLNRLFNGTDATGQGSYQTAVAFNFQHLTEFKAPYFLRNRLSLSYLYPARVEIHGLSAYSGTPQTEGVISPGSLVNIDWAGEFTVSQNWVLVMETYYIKRQASGFRGRVGINDNGTPGTIGHGPVKEWGMAPAIEYNFTENIGVIAGKWFALTGRETSSFETYVIALNAYW